MKQINRAAAQITLLAAAILMIGYGAMRGEAAMVLSKAIKLCLECVGIG
ncbi:MAG: CD1871A family CXXC motif-containing protein [Agathobacter sp.]|nr:CD1871A family CXXC motif-containing protein [Agathobacter sp.]